MEVLHAESNPFLATIGLRVEPAPEDSGVELRLRVDPRAVPMYIYQSVADFGEVIGQHVRQALREGLPAGRSPTAS